MAKAGDLLTESDVTRIEKAAVAEVKIRSPLLCETKGGVCSTCYGRDLARNPRAVLLFFWSELERQVRIEGTVSKVSSAESDAYYPTRPLGSRLGAWASPQSEVLPDRAVLEQRLADMTQRLGDNPPRPPYWGGYRLVPDSLEFWQGRPSRLHDRLRYRRSMPGPDAWIRERLAP